MFELDLYFHILRFHCKSVNLSWGISHRITELEVRYFDKSGYVEFNTNIGLEAIDILDENVPLSYQKIVKEYLSKAKELKVKIIK